MIFPWVLIKYRQVNVNFYKWTIPHIPNIQAESPTLEFQVYCLECRALKIQKSRQASIFCYGSFHVESKPIHDWPIFKESLEGRDQVDAVSPIDLRDYHQLMPSLLLGGVL